MNGSGRPANTPTPSWLISDVLPCITLRRAHDLAAEELADALVAEAHAEHRDAALAEVADRVVREAGVLGPARARARSSTASGVERDDLVERDRVVAVHDRLRAELTEVLHEVVDERVVVVDDEDASSHGASTLVP